MIRYRIKRFRQYASILLREVMSFFQEAVTGKRPAGYPEYIDTPSSQMPTRIGTPAWTSLRKLHIGCGETYLESYVNIDAPEDHESLSDNPRGIKPDHRCSIHDLSAFENDSVDVIEGYHVIEHVPYWVADQSLKEFHRALKPGGELVLECPDLWKCSINYLELPEYTKLGLEGFFGDRKHHLKSMVHQYGYSAFSMADALRCAGFQDSLIIEIPGRRYTSRDLRVIAFKAPLDRATLLQRVSDRLLRDTINLYTRKTTSQPQGELTGHAH